MWKVANGCRRCDCKKSQLKMYVKKMQIRLGIPQNFPSPHHRELARNARKIEKINISWWRVRELVPVVGSDFMKTCSVLWGYVVHPHRSAIFGTLLSRHGLCRICVEICRHHSVCFAPPIAILFFEKLRKRIFIPSNQTQNAKSGNPINRLKVRLKKR